MTARKRTTEAPDAFINALDLLKRMRSAWVTAPMLANEIGTQNIDFQRAKLSELELQGFAVSRTGKESTPTGGRRAREYTLAKEWGGNA